MVTRREMILTGAALAGATATLAKPNTVAAAQTGASGLSWERSYSGTPESKTLPPGQPAAVVDVMLV